MPRLCAGSSPPEGARRPLSRRCRVGLGLWVIMPPRPPATRSLEVGLASWELVVRALEAPPRLRTAGGQSWRSCGSVWTSCPWKLASRRAPRPSGRPASGCRAGPALWTRAVAPSACRSRASSWPFRSGRCRRSCRSPSASCTPARTAASRCWTRPRARARALHCSRRRSRGSARHSRSTARRHRSSTGCARTPSWRRWSVS
mmetsp:Transcript_129953/g.417102  ORF Transcript_129953/g.417102 Transcript_129953/m.417102 type:complete len:202 (+) Transcript_129953:182-787(+)